MDMEILLKMVVNGTLLLLAVLFFRQMAFHQVPKRLFVLLWTGTLARLLVPFSVPVTWSLQRFLSCSRGLSGLHTGAAPDDGVFGVLSGAMPAQWIRGYDGPVGEVLEIGGTIPGSGLPLLPVLFTVWLAGALLLASWILLNHRRCIKKYKTSLPTADPAVRDWLNHRSGIRGIQVRISDQIPGPMTYGLLNPVILLPSNLNLGGTELICVLEHEWVHIRRYDILTKYLMWAAVCAYWFHPLLWVMASLLNRDMELACDEAVISGQANCSREDYAMLLIRLAESQPTAWQAGACFTRYTKLEERIQSIMNKKKYTWKSAALAAAMALCVGFAFTSTAQTPTPESASGEVLQTSAEPAPAPTAKSPEPISLPQVSDSAVTGEQITELAVKYVGGPYRYGGTDLYTGVDCTGFVKAIYSLVDIELPSHMNELANAGTVVSAEELAPGDLVLYGKTLDDQTVSIEHVALYLGDSQVIHASNAREGVKISDLGYREICLRVHVLN